MESRVKELLAKTYSDVEVMANLQWDWAASQSEAIVYALPVPDQQDGAGVPSRRISEESEMTGTTPNMEPGVQSNNETPTYPTGGGGTEEASSTRTDTEFLYNQTRTNTDQPPSGSPDLANSSIAVRVFQPRVYEEEALRAAGTLAQDTSWEEFKANTLRELAAAQVPDTTLDLIRSATGIQAIQAELFETPVFYPSPARNNNLNQWLMAGMLLLLIALLAFGLIRRTQPDEITEIEPELSVEELLVSSDAQEEPVVEEVPSIDYFSDSELKRQIDKFVDEKPEAAAQLLRNWLTEDWE